MSDDFASGSGPAGVEGPVAAIGTAAGFGALFSAAACCVLPLAFAVAGLGAGGLAAVVPFHWPLTIAAGAAVAAGWALYLRKRRACAVAPGCDPSPSRATFAMLCAASLMVALSALWPAFLEQPLTALLAGS